RRDLVDRRLDEVACVIVRGEQRRDFFLEARLPGTRVIEDDRAIGRIARDDGVEDFADAEPFLRGHTRSFEPSALDSPGASARASQALASVQRRFTVAGETPSASAASSIERPPKKRMSTRRASSASNAASFVNASSSASTSRDRDVAAISPGSSVTLMRL